MALLENIQKICRKHTPLSEEEIDLIYQHALQLPLIADLAQANIFIDCPTKEEKKAVVVAEAAPKNAPSLYHASVVGMFAYDSYEPAVALTHKKGRPFIQHKAITQEGKAVKQSVVPIKNSSGKTIGSLIMEQDITEQISDKKRVKDLSQTTEQLSQTLIDLTREDAIIPELMQESLFLLDQDGVILYTNSCGLRLVNDLQGNVPVVGTSIYDRFPFLLEHEDKEDVFYKELQVFKKTLEVKRVCLKREGQKSGSLLIIKDLTELREKERQLLVKSAVIKEIHHRVKNNLQTVASLLRLQMKHEVPEDSKIFFKESLNRILSISSVHEILCDSGMEEVEIYQLIHKIGNMLIQHRDSLEPKVDINYEGLAIHLPSEKAVSICLVVNELIQNSLKHAFHQKEKGEIRVCLSSIDAFLEIAVEDNGTGFDSLQPSSFGLEIVRVIVEHDLAGKFTLESTGSGTKASFIFPIREVQAC